ncbi:hypothetical protein O181_078178 [Austropuccinia psidii MF-1]|uniref:3-methyl-2-oxobutanoate hydroxymethyltransferase n=1 Tax=Austropuccinia psidii MF-1 TaxID=1389203 RepID=A0A9Q3IEE4_9BASI|nr:hypothetical protein [Austropuccinia psidii MF-1]
MFISAPGSSRLLTKKFQPPRRRFQFKTYSALPLNSISLLAADQARNSESKSKSQPIKVPTIKKNQPSHLVTFKTLNELHLEKVPITVLTAHDFPTARILAMSASYPNPTLVGPPGIDICLCGDSLANVSLGYSSTTQLGLEEFSYHLKAVRRGLDSLKQETFYRIPLLIADLPFGSFEESIEQGMRTAIKLTQLAQIDGVKIEGGPELVPLIERLTSYGIPVVAHIGLTPQRTSLLGGFRVQGHDSSIKARQIIADALQLEKAGCVALVIEAVPIELVDQLIPQLSIPVIGIGAGPATDGQVLVLTDLVGALDTPIPKFVPNFTSSLNLNFQARPTWEIGLQIINEYVTQVRLRKFPQVGQHTYQMKPNVLQELQRKGWSQ